MNESLGKIYDLVSNKSLSKHQLILNLHKILCTEKPFLPPLLCKCEIELKNGKKFSAFLEIKKPPFYFKDENDSDEYFWKVLSKNPFKRYCFSLSEVHSWIFI